MQALLQEVFLHLAYIRPTATFKNAQKCLKEPGLPVHEGGVTGTYKLYSQRVRATPSSQDNPRP